MERQLVEELIEILLQNDKNIRDELLNKISTGGDTAQSQDIEKIVSEYIEKNKESLKGDKGDPGQDGKDGEDGVTPNLTIGTVETLSAGSQAIATITGTIDNLKLNLSIPEGNSGDGSDYTSLKQFLLSTFEELKMALESSDTEGAIAILDEAILDLSTLSPDDKATLVSISATYNGGDVPQGTTTSTLSVSVIGEYSDGTTVDISDGYTLSPTSISEGLNTITVSYNNKTSIFNVVGVSVQKELESISAVHNDATAELYTDAGDLNLSVTGHYSDGSTIEITNYSIAGTVQIGENIFVVEYAGLTCNITVIGDEFADTESDEICYVGMIEGEMKPKIKMYSINNPGGAGIYYIRPSSSGNAILGVFGVESGKTYEIKEINSINYNNMPNLSTIYYLNGTPPLHPTEGYGYVLSDVLVLDESVSGVKGAFTYQFTVPENTTRCLIVMSGVRSWGDYTLEDAIAHFEEGLTIREVEEV